MGASKHIAVLAGGYSGEADVSRRSAAMVMAHMDRARFTPYLVHIDPDGWWVEPSDSGTRTPVDKDTLAYTNAEGATVRADLAFVMVHGTPGEDGLLQAHLDLCGIPHTTASATRRLGRKALDRRSWLVALGVGCFPLGCDSPMR